MAPRKKRTKQDTLTAEFTTYQLVIGVCVALVFAIFFFALGVLVGKGDSSLHQDNGTTIAQQEKATEAPAKTEEEKKTLTPTQQMLAQKANAADLRTPAPPRSRRAPYIPKLPDEQPVPVENPSPTRSVELPAPPAKPAEPEEPVKEEATAPVETADSSTTKQPPAELTPSTSDELKIEEARTETTPVEAPITAPVNTDNGAFGIQIAAFLRPDGTQKADDLKKQINTKLNINAQVFTSSDNNYSKVIIPGYKNKPEAVAALATLKEKDPLLASAWVTKIPQ